MVTCILRNFSAKLNSSFIRLANGFIEANDLALTKDDLLRDNARGNWCPTFDQFPKQITIQSSGFPAD
jgi:hypothetical protein